MAMCVDIHKVSLFQKTTVSSMVPRHWMMLLDMTVSMSCCRCFFASSLPT